MGKGYTAVYFAFGGGDRTGKRVIAHRDAEMPVRTRDRPSRLPGPGADRRGSTWKGDIAFSATVALLVVLLILRVFPELLQGQLIDPDSYMRLVRVRRLLGPGGWFDGTIPRSNAPFGETLHWTRPVDVLVILGAWIGRPFLSPDRALHMAGVLLSPLLLIAVCLTTAWAARPLAGGRARYYVMLAVLAQAGIMGYALPGRADHNMLILLAFVAMLGSTLRVLLGPTPPGHAWAAGAWAGCGLWVSTEFVAPLSVLLGTLLVLWVWHGKLAARARAVAAALLLVVVLAVVVEHPPAGLLHAEYDRISVVHVLMAALTALFWLGTLPASRLRLPGRLAYASIGALAAGGVILAIYPDFFGGPMASMDPELRRTWLPMLTEFQPYLVPRGLAGVGRIIAYLGHPLLALGVVAHGLRRDRDSALVGAWVLLGLGLLVFIPLGIRWVRFVMYAEIFGVLGTIFLLARVVKRLADRPSGMRTSFTRGLAAAALLTGPLLLGAGVMALGGEAGETVQQAAATEIGACPVTELVSVLNDPDGLGGSPRTILAHIDLGPTLLYRTPHSVVATPYHRNVRGILDWRGIMGATDMDEARRLIQERQVDLVLACGRPQPPAPVDAPSFASRIRSGAVPRWLTPVPAPDPVGGLLIYTVDLRDPRPDG
jgi:hypothetical protein